MDSFESDGQVTYTNQDLQEMDQRPIAHDRVRLQKDMLDFLRNFSETGGESFPYRTLHPRPAAARAARRRAYLGRGPARLPAHGWLLRRRRAPSAAGNGGGKWEDRMNGGSCGKR